MSFEPIFEKNDTYVLVRGEFKWFIDNLLNISAPPNSDWSFFDKYLI